MLTSTVVRCFVVFRDVGNTKAREKTSQALREGAPDLRSPHNKGGNKEGQIIPHSVSPVGGASLTVRKQPEFQVGYNSGLGLYAATGASVVENHASDIDASFVGPAAKKLRADGALAPMVSGTSQFWGGPQHSFLHGMGAPASHFMHVPPPSLPVKPVISSPGPFAAAVSADDDDSKSDDRHAASPKPETESPKPRGPRIKLLKRRLEQEQAC